MATVIRSKENDCDFPLFKTPKRASLLSSAAINDLAFYSSHLKRLAGTSTAGTSELQTYNSTTTTPIRLNRNRVSTPGSIQRRRALGLVNSNSKQPCQMSSDDEISSLSNVNGSNPKHDESVMLQAPSPTTMGSDPDDDLPHPFPYHRYEDTFDDLIPANERVEHMARNQFNSVNVFTFHGGIENTIRYQSPQCSRVALSTLLDMLN